MSTLQHYVSAFSSLHTNKQKGVKAPHKAVLLMAVIDLVEEGAIGSPCIVLTKELEERFYGIWRRYIGHSAVFTPNIAQPFFHMQHEEFWRLVSREEATLLAAAEEEDTVASRKTTQDLPAGSYSVKAMRAAFACAEIDRRLFEILQDNNARALLRVILINNYFTNHPTKSMPDLTDLLLALSVLVLAA